MSATLGQTEMESQMQKHWNTWITAEDFSAMASYGINMVRIPIGYWSVTPINGDPYVQGAYDYLAQVRRLMSRIIPLEEGTVDLTARPVFKFKLFVEFETVANPSIFLF